MREEHDFAQAAAVSRLKTKRQQGNKRETGVERMGVDKDIPLAKQYNVSVDYLLGPVDIPRKPQ